MTFRRFLYRSWFYLRVGYSTYIAFLISFAANIIVIYELAIVDTGFLSIFPRLTLFAIVAVLVASPISVLIGLLHMRRTGAYAADASVTTESNPYVYKVIPGKEQEVTLPLSILTARGLLKMAGSELTADEKREFEKVLAKADKLLAGQSIGKS